MSKKPIKPKRKQIKYRKIDVAIPSTDNEQDYKDNDTDNDNKIQQNDSKPNKQKLNEIKTCSHLCTWMKQDPLSKLPFLYFFISIFVPFGLSVYYFMDNDSSYIISGIFGISLSFYAFNHFRILLGLKHQINQFSKLNQKFSTQNNKLLTEVNRIKFARDTLKNTHNKLLDCNLQQKENLRQFRSVEDNMRAMDLNKMVGIDKVREKSKAIYKKWKDELLTKERDIITRLFDRFEENDNTKKEGMNKKEFNQFIEMVPPAYKSRFKRLGTFNKLSKNKSSINYRDFESCLDIFARMDVEDRDILFKIEKKERKNQNNLSVPNGNKFRDNFVRSITVLDTSNIEKKNNDDNKSNKNNMSSDDEFDTDAEWSSGDDKPVLVKGGFKITIEDLSKDTSKDKGNKKKKIKLKDIDVDKMDANQLANIDFGNSDM